MGHRGGQGLQRRPQVNLVEVIEKYLGGGRAATVHHHEIEFCRTRGTCASSARGWDKSINSTAFAVKSCFSVEFSLSQSQAARSDVFVFEILGRN